MESRERGPSRKHIYQDGGGSNPRIHPPVVVLSDGGEVTWENLTARPVELHFPGGDRYLTDPGPVRVNPGETSPPKQIERGAPRRAFAYRAVQIGDEHEPDLAVHGNSDPIIIIR